VKIVKPEAVMLMPCDVSPVTLPKDSALVLNTSGRLLLLLTTTVYVAPFCPCVKLPVWTLVAARIDCGMIVGSLSVAVAELPPDTLTWLVSNGGASVATFTVTVIGK
jgi:hypothetical protein